MEAVLIILLGLVCTVCPFVMGQAYGHIRFFSPMHLVSYFCGLGFLLKVSVYLGAPELAFYRRFVDNPWGDLLGAFYLSLFVLMLCLGYRFACRSFCRSDSVIAARAVASAITRRGSLFLLAFAVAGGTFLLMLLARGGEVDADFIASVNNAKQINVNAEGVGATLAGIKTLFVVPKFAFVLLLAHGIATRHRNSLSQAALLAILMVAIAVISGDRFELAELLVFALSVHAILGGQFNWRAVAGTVAGLAALGVVSAYMTQLRLGLDGDVIWGTLLQQIVGSTYFLDINVAAMVADRVQPSDLMLGQSYLWWTFGWVPRALWFDKPAIDLGVFFKRDIMQMMTGGAYNVTGPGEAFINFGWAGALVGLVLGWLYRKGEAALLSAYGAIRCGAFLLYPILFYPFVQATLQSSFSAFIVGAAAQLVLIALMIAVFVTRFSIWIPSHHHSRSQLYVA